jgi:hypothetical protein
MGAGTPTVTLAYTDQDGNTETTGTSGALGSAMANGRTNPFTLAEGDTGVASIQTWTASATFTSGTIGLVIRRLVCLKEFPDLTRPAIHDALSVGLPRVYDDACLEVLLRVTANSPINGSLSMHLVQG